MWHRIYHWMRIGQYQNPLDQRKAAMLLFVLLITLFSPIGTITVTIVASMSSATTTNLISMVLAGLVLSFVSLLLLRTGRLQVTAWIVTLVCVSILNYIYIQIGSARGGVFLYFYALPILCSALIGTRRMVVASGLLSVVGVGVALELEPNMRQIVPYYQDPLATLTFFTTVTSILTLITAYFSYSYQKSLALSIQREHDLEQMRVSLASDVNVRTQELRQALQAVEMRELNLAHALSNLRDSEARQRAILEAIPDAIYRTNRNGVCLDYKPERAFAVTLIDAANAVGQPTNNLLSADLAVILQENVGRVLANGESQQFEYQVTVEGVLRDREIRMVQCGTDEVLSIARDITDRKKVDRLKSEFVSVVSHELRTPLTSIRGAIGLVAGGVTGAIPPPALTMLDIAQKNSERLLRLINDILDIEKIETGNLAFDLQPLMLSTLIEQAVMTNQSYGAQYGVALALAGSLPNVCVLVDSDRFQQVLANLISNAIKFSPAGADVLLSVRAHNGRVRVAVMDQGPGIPKAFQDQIFQKFAQADSSDQRQKGGAGLGLSIAKAIVERFGGVIGFSIEPGVGTTFFFELPLVAWDVSSTVATA